MFLFDRLLDVLAAVAAALLVLIMFSVGADVILRSTIGHSLTWSLEFSEHALLGILFLGMPWLAREKGHVAVELVTETLPANLKKPLARIIAFICACLLAFLAWWASKLALQDYAMNVKTIGIHPIPRYILPAVVSFGLLLTSLTYLRETLFPARYGPSTTSGPVA
ncbi:MAG: TRAP transporter small permease [Rhizobiaceae bacterium]|nr:TRAP transporter small permease [Rhizobiaceae bacterium]